MPTPALYEDPILKIYFDLIDANDGGAIKSFHYGDPVFIPKSDLSALIGQIDTTEITDLTNAEDVHRFNIVLTLVTDIRNFFNQDSSDANENIHYGYQQALKIMEERDSNLELVATSIADIIRSNANPSNNLWLDVNVPLNITYGFTQGFRGEKSWAWEAYCSFTVLFSQDR